MKKLLALLLAAMMLLVSVAALGEAVEVTDYVPTELDTADLLDFTLAMDAIPEGYTMATFASDGDLYAFFINKDDENAVVYMVSVAHSETFDLYTMKLEELTDEEIANVYAMVTDDYSNPDISFSTTSHGTDVILVNENGTLTDYAEYITIYEGYFISVAMLKDSELTDEDLALGLQLLSDMWIVPAK